ncbi:hypothetical protein MAJ_06539, partial [Metarhizium majus ARSEF 297]
MAQYDDRLYNEAADTLRARKDLHVGQDQVVVVNQRANKPVWCHFKSALRLPQASPLLID